MAFTLIPLQTYIRRGEEENARRFLGHVLSHEDDRLLTNTKNRLRIIFLENVADVSILTYRFIALKTNQDISDLIHVLCFSTKAKICSHAQAFAKAIDNNDQNLSSLSREDSLLITHVRRQKELIPKPEWKLQLSNALKYKCNSAILWAYQISMCSTKRPVLQIFKVLKAFISASILNKFKKMYSLLKNFHQSFMCWMLPILTYLRPRTETRYRFRSVVCIPKRITQLDDNSDFNIEFVTPENKQQINNGWKQYYLRLKELESESPATRKKRKMPPLEIVPMFKKGRFSPFVKNEQDRFHFQVRSRLCCSDSNTDVYFAFDVETKKNVVVKGPIPDGSIYASYFELNEWKRSVGLPSLQSIRQAKLGVNMFLYVPSNVRQKYEQGASGTFICYDSLLDRAPTIYDRIYKSSDRYTDEEVLDWDKFPHHVFNYNNWNNYSAQIRQDYVHGLIARYIHSLGDLNYHNFVIAHGRLYSIDDDVPISNIPNSIGNGMKTHLANYVHRHEANIRRWIAQLTFNTPNIRLIELKTEPNALITILK